MKIMALVLITLLRITYDPCGYGCDLQQGVVIGNTADGKLLVRKDDGKMDAVSIWYVTGSEYVQIAGRP